MTSIFHNNSIFIINKKSNILKNILKSSCSSLLIHQPSVKYEMLFKLKNIS